MGLELGTFCSSLDAAELDDSVSSDLIILDDVIRNQTTETTNVPKKSERF
jgi:hypothetical protein